MCGREREREKQREKQTEEGGRLWRKKKKMIRKRGRGREKVCYADRKRFTQDGTVSKTERREKELDREERNRTRQRGFCRLLLIRKLFTNTTSARCWTLSVLSIV